MQLKTPVVRVSGAPLEAIWTDINHMVRGLSGQGMLTYMSFLWVAVLRVWRHRLGGGGLGGTLLSMSAAFLLVSTLAAGDSHGVVMLSLAAGPLP